MPKLICVSRYRTATLSVDVGQVLDLSEAEAAQLLADAPGCWADAEAPAEPETAALDEAPTDKMIKRSVRK